jgi:hypothetical protein
MLRLYIRTVTGGAAAHCLHRVTSAVNIAVVERCYNARRVTNNSSLVRFLQR